MNIPPLICGNRIEDAVAESNGRGCDLFPLRRERLVRERRRCRALDDDEAAASGLMAGVACRRELVEGCCERLAVARLDGGLDLVDWRHRGGLDHLADR